MVILAHQLTRNYIMKRIIERAQKLIALANNNPNESEAAIAMERAYKLLAKHNLSLGEIGDKAEDCGQDSSQINFGGPWARTISNHVAKLYFCDMFYTKMSGRQEKHTFVGLEHNVALAQQIAMTVLTIIHKDGKKQANGSTPFLNSFRNAASSRIAQRCLQLITEAKKGELQNDDGESIETGTGMVLASVYDNEQKRIDNYNSEKNPNLKNVRFRSRSSNESGRAAGTAAGNSVGLRPEVSSNSNRRIK